MKKRDFFIFKTYNLQQHDDCCYDFTKVVQYPSSRVYVAQIHVDSSSRYRVVKTNKMPHVASDFSQKSHKF